MVAIRIIKYWATLASYEEGEGCPILATSDSNIAVDNLVEGCANVGLRVVRLGRPEAVRPELLRYCIDRPGASSSTLNISSMESQDGANPQSDSGFSSSLSASSYKEKMKRMKAAQVICCTCIGSGADILDSMCFERVLVDEATQATEPAVLVPLTRGCRQLVLVGDHCQVGSCTFFHAMVAFLSRIKFDPLFPYFFIFYLLFTSNLSYRLLFLVHVLRKKVLVFPSSRGWLLAEFLHSC
jgi:hypothetical protein